MQSSVLYPVVQIFQSIAVSFHPKRNYYHAIKKLLGYYPRKFVLYETAFTHKSASVSDENGGNAINNERLEFLGDAILDAVIADFLYIKFPETDEGFLTQMRSKIVKREFLNSLSLKLGIDKLIISHSAAGVKSQDIYGDTFEALVGAIYLDMGYHFTKRFIIEKIIKKYINVVRLAYIDTNYKSRLIEWAQKHKKDFLFHTVADTSNPELFISTVSVDGETISQGTAHTKKEAEQGAAKLAVNMLFIE